MRIQAWLLIMVMAGLPLLAGCLSLSTQSEEKPPTRYLLNPLPSAPSGEGAPRGRRPTVSVELPSMAPGLDTDRIALVREGRRLEYFAGARWATPLPDLLQAFFAESLEHRIPGARAGSPADVSGADYQLRMVVHDFQAEYEGGINTTPDLVVGLAATLSRPGGKRVLAQVRESRRSPAAANRLGSVVQGLEKLLQDAYGSVLRDLREKLRNRPSTRKSEVE